VRRTIGCLILTGLVWLLVAGNSAAEPPTPLYEGTPPANSDVDNFYRYMALLGRIGSARLFSTGSG